MAKDTQRSLDVKEDRRQAALDYHEFPTPGKISIAATKQLVNQSDLALAYSPGVAAACEAIVEDPQSVFRFTARGNLFGVINLEDIKAPECFIVERELRERMKIPVFHDDQHGTAITVGAAIINGLQ